MQDVAVRNPGPLARLEELKADAAAPSLIFQRLTERESLPAIAKALQVPKGRFVQWFITVHAELYDAAAKVVALDMALEAAEVAKGVPRQAVDSAGKPLFDEAGKPLVVEPDVARDKLYVDTLLKLASKYDRVRYGDSMRIEKAVTFDFDTGLMGTVGALLQRAAEPARLPEKVLNPMEEPI